jgi:predicted transcriptional regulator YdeE
MAIEEDEYRIEPYDKFTVAGVAERGTDIDPKALWADLDEFADDLHDVAVSDVKYGVFFEFDQGGEEVTYLVGHEVESTGDLPPQLTAVEIPEGHYAVISLDDVDFDRIRPTIIEELRGDTGHEMQGEPVFHRDTSTGQSFDFNGTSEWFMPVEDE